MTGQAAAQHRAVRDAEPAGPVQAARPDADAAPVPAMLLRIQRLAGNRAAGALVVSRQSHPVDIDAGAVIEAALRVPDWTRVARTLPGMRAPERAALLRARTSVELGRIAEAARAAGLAQVAALVEPFRLTRLRSEYDQALAGHRWAELARVMHRYNENDILTMARALSPEARRGLAAAAAPGTAMAWASRVYRAVRFVDSGADRDRRPRRPNYTLTDPGRETANTPVEGGRVSVRTGVAAELGEPAADPFAEISDIATGAARPRERAAGGWQVSYTGAEAGRTSIIQVGWQELERGPGARGGRYHRGSMETTSGTWEFTTDPRSPHWVVDTGYVTSAVDRNAGRRDEPFYETLGASRRAADMIAMMDAPSALEPFARRDLEEGATWAEGRLHFSAYVVRDMRVLYRVDFLQRCRYTYPNHVFTHSAPTVTMTREGPADALEPPHRNAILARFPAYDYLP